ncbi:MFS transporter [Halioglobus maricola]|uniref:MFS transporter n=1 Tax=Halioglobus maricola TaxID=2601894 RepID=A0A5P9NLY2_9GAMM|nr:MFS transporter [Halioglobus maricola]QFU76840.1 MFS transporter [Halioglobus maricola]
MNEFKLGWKIVLVAMLGVAFNGSNILLYTIGALAPQLSQEFGWSHGSIQLGSLFSIGTVVLALPLAGYLSDKYGVRRLTLFSIILTSLCIALHAFLSQNIVFYYMLAVLTALAFVGSLPLTWTKMVTSWFDRRLGLALGLTLLGTGLGGAILKPTTAGLIAELGWRGAYVVLGIIPLVVVFPLVIAWFKEPTSRIVKAVRVDEDGTVVAPHVPVKKPFKDWRFWAIAIAYIPIGFAVAGLITNMEVILASGGADAALVVTAGTTFGVSVVIGRIIGGYMLDKYNPGIVGSTLIMSLSIAFILLSQPDLSVSITLLAIALAGFGTGVEFDVLSYLIHRIFGSEHYAKIFGSIMALLYIGSAFGPVLFGSTYDKYGSFGPVLIPVAVGVFIASVLIGTLSGSLRASSS